MFHVHGVYVNPDGNEAAIRQNGLLDVAAFGASTSVNSYFASVALLLEAIKHTNRAYIFDNSTDSADPQLAWIAEIADGRRLELKTDRIPAWFKRAVIEKIA